MKALSQLLDILFSLLKYFKIIKAEVEKREINDAAQESLDSKDQRKLEDALGGSGPKSDIPGVRERPVKKPS